MYLLFSFLLAFLLVKWLGFFDDSSPITSGFSMKMGLLETFLFGLALYLISVLLRPKLTFPKRKG